MKIFHCAANSGLLSCLPMVYPACCPCSSSLPAENYGGGLLPLGSNSTVDGYIPTAVAAAVVQSVRPISNPTTETPPTTPETARGGLLPLGSNSTVDGYIPTAVAAAVVQSVRPISNPTTETPPTTPETAQPNEETVPAAPEATRPNEETVPATPEATRPNEETVPATPETNRPNEEAARKLPDQTKKPFQPRRKLIDQMRKRLHLRRFDRYPLFVCRKTGKSLPQPAAPHNFGFGIPKPSMPLYCTCFHRRWQDRTLPFLKTPSRLHLTGSTLFLSC